jgi:hypothetical protein
MTAADTDVRPGRHAPGATPRGAGGWRLARLLLDFLETFVTRARKLDRKAVLPLLLAASLTPACIIPVGPEWHDPLGVPNAAPEILNPNHEEGAEVFATATDPAEFEFSVNDVNGDRLSFRVILHDQVLRTDTVVTPRIMERIECNMIANKTVTRHPIKIVVADRAFTSDNLGVSEGGKLAIITWNLNMACQL